MANHKLSTGWYDEGYFIRGLTRDGVATGWRYRETGRGSSHQQKKVDRLLAAADAGADLESLSAEYTELFRPVRS
jgi:hypothetical protein